MSSPTCWPAAASASPARSACPTGSTSSSSRRRWTASSACPDGSDTFRCSPGLGADVVAMACLTIVAAATRGDGDSLVSGVCLALAFSTLPRIVWQFYLFLQTDIYYLAATVLGCIDLHRTSRQWLANRVNRFLGRNDRLVDESTWHPHDRRAARWYGPLMVAGYTAAVVMAVLVAIPLAWHLFGGAAKALSVG